MTRPQLTSRVKLVADTDVERTVCTKGSCAVSSETSGEAVGVSCGDYIQPSCCRLIPSFQIFVKWRILSPSNCMT